MEGTPPPAAGPMRASIAVGPQAPGLGRALRGPRPRLGSSGRVGPWRSSRNPARPRLGDRWCGRRIAKLRTERKRRRRAVAEARTEVERLRSAASDGIEPEMLVAGLEGQVPVALLPVRLETRFTADATGLRIRIFPEPIHEDHHEPELTAAERQAAEDYWRARWAAGENAEQARAAWRHLTSGVPAPRARWLVDATTPTNLGRLGQGRPAFPEIPERPAPWTRAARAELLPERWVALGYRAGQEVLRAWGATVSEQLAMGPAPDLDPSGEAPVGDDEPADRRRAALADGLRRGAAKRHGDHGDRRRHERRRPWPRAWTRSWCWASTGRAAPRRPPKSLDAQLAAKRASDGLSFIAAGTPTNNTGESPAGDDAAAALDPFDPTPATGPQSAGRRAERALGLQGRSVLRRAPGAGALDDDAARHMANVLWPTTWGYFLDQIMEPLVNDGAEAGARAHFRRYVRGPRPAPHDPRRSPALRAAAGRRSRGLAGRRPDRSGDRQPRARTPACCGSAPS